MWPETVGPGPGGGQFRQERKLDSGFCEALSDVFCGDSRGRAMKELHRAFSRHNLFSSQVCLLQLVSEVKLLMG